MNIAFHERRSSPRQAGSGCHWIHATLVRPGREVRLLDLSPGGALVESGTRLLPGSIIDFHVHALDRRHTIRSCVVRCAVSAVDAHFGVRYRAALRFDHVFRGADPPRAAERGGSEAGEHHASGPRVLHAALG